MPNFFSKATQAIYEKFNGPGTVDLEFDAKYKQVIVFKKNSDNLKQVFINIQKNTMGKSI
jgi:hypothetical protein